MDLHLVRTHTTKRIDLFALTNLPPTKQKGLAYAGPFCLVGRVFATLSATQEAWFAFCELCRRELAHSRCEQKIFAIGEYPPFWATVIFFVLGRWIRKGVKKRQGLPVVFILVFAIFVFRFSFIYPKIFLPTAYRFASPGG